MYESTLCGPFGQEGSSLIYLKKRICGILEILVFDNNICFSTMDPEKGCGLPSTGQKVRLLIGTAHWFLNSIGWISAATIKPLAYFQHC